jgi:DNA polymerase-3 subunit gamma/tau
VVPTPEPAGNLADHRQQIIETIARQNPSLAANLAKCQINKPEGQILVIEVPGNGFTLNMIQRDKNMAVLKQVCTDILGSRHELQFKACDSAKNKSQKKKKDNQLKQKAISHPLVADAIEIFDGKLIDVKIL